MEQSECPRLTAAAPSSPPTEATKAYADLVALHPLTLQVPRGAVGRAGRAQRLGQVHLPRPGRRAARAQRRRDHGARRAGRLLAGAGGGELPARRAGALRRPVGARAPRLRRGPPRGDRRRGRPRRAARAARAPRPRRRPAGPVQPRPPPEARRSRSAWCGPSSSCSSTSPSWASTPPARRRCSTILDELHADGAALVVATHDPTFVERVDRCIALRDGVVIHDGPATPVGRPPPRRRVAG